MTKLKSGDLITVEAVKQSYKEKGDINIVIVETEEASSELSLIKQLQEMSVHKVDKNDVHPDFAALNVDICHYSMRSIKIESVTFPDENTARVNGEYDISLKGTKGGKVLDSYFFDEAIASTIANSLNEVELEKAEMLANSAAKARTMLTDIVKKGYV